MLGVVRYSVGGSVRYSVGGSVVLHCVFESELHMGRILTLCVQKSLKLLNNK